ncbi:arrestin domain-containing protein 3-like [Chaetodon auriga]|uniref:arrestin domain-containing protein 3-like n=1 Tax=Chaetodon auriga TaxID=39042 RepID=UPI004032FB23
MRADSKAKAHFTLVHNGTIDSDLMLKAPQYGNTEKKMKLFSSGAVAMDVNIERTGYHQGEGIKVVANIQNSSSRDIKPKYHLYEKRSYLAKGKRKVRTTDILKEVGDAVPPSGGQAVTRIINIPSATLPSILNCKVLKREYRLRVSLDIKYASDPEIKLPIVILQALQDPDDAYPQFSMFSGSSALPPANGIAGMYPSLTDFEGSSC